MLRYAEYREVKGHGGARRKELKSEVPVCPDCYVELCPMAQALPIAEQDDPKFENKLPIDPALLGIDTTKPMNLDEVESKLNPPADA